VNFTEAHEKNKSQMRICLKIEHLTCKKILKIGLEKNVYLCNHDLLQIGFELVDALKFRYLI